MIIDARYVDTHHIDEDDYFAHYGILRRSGRYPWGSGGNLELETAKSFLDYVEYLRRKLGLSEAEIAQDLGISTTRLRAEKSIAKNEARAADITMAQRLKDKGYSNVAIGERMGVPESTVRNLLKPGAADKADNLTQIANMLRDQTDQHKYIDIGSGVENHIGVSATKLKTAVAILENEGYSVEYIKVPQLGTDKDTTQMVLVKPGIPYADVYADRENIKLITAFSNDGGRKFAVPDHEPIAVDPKRVGVLYAEDGGAQADGVIYIRPGVEDLNMGSSTYAQVRIKVGDDHYLKGMAMYKDDLPDGVDLLFNTNKSDTGNPLDSMKKITDDPDLPFGSIVRQVVENPGTPQERNISALNIVNEEGDWTKWSKTLSPQVLSKQDPKLAREQLNVSMERREDELAEIMALTNPTVRKKLLMEFAEGTDAASIHLKSAALPRQSSHVILPVQSLPKTEVYAPNYVDGERVVLIRYPHGGTFEIPELTVNNKHPESRKLLGQARDAIGINHVVAEQLSGADFDGDTVLVIPNGRNKIRADKAIQDLVEFDPRSSYPGYEGMRQMTNTQTEMGKVSNLITDMTIKAAPTNEIVRAVKHSMVVIDAEKHGLNYKQSEIDHGIKDLKAKYQTNADGTSGAATIVSRAKGRADILDRKPRPAAEGGPIDRETGELVYVPTGKTRYSDGKPSTQKKAAIEVVSDARELSSGTQIENLYADYSNNLKALANRARKEAVNTPRAEYSPSAKKAYQTQVDSLNAQLQVALRNRPLERQAQVIANATVKAKRDANPTMDKDTLKKIKSKALSDARARTGAGKTRITITDKEWEAIQAGAISDSKLSTILQNADMDVVKTLATPRSINLMTSAKSTRAQSMLDRGFTRAEVAAQLGVSLSTLDRELYSES